MPCVSFSATIIQLSPAQPSLEVSEEDAKCDSSQRYEEELVDENEQIGDSNVHSWFDIGH